MEQARERRRRNEYRETYNEIHKAIENITRTANTQIVPLQLIKGVGAVIGLMICAAKFFFCSVVAIHE
jgi:hypothetical protein